MSKKVLIIDDELTVRATCKRIIQSAGHRVLEGESPIDAINISKTAKPDLILLDINLDTDSSGIDACKVIKENPSTKNIPVLMLTGSASREDVVGSTEAGADGYVLKPFTKDTLLSKMAEVLHIEQQDDIPIVEPTDLSPMPDDN